MKDFIPEQMAIDSKLKSGEITEEQWKSETRKLSDEYERLSEAESVSAVNPSAKP